MDQSRPPAFPRPPSTRPRNHPLQYRNRTGAIPVMVGYGNLWKVMEGYGNFPASVRPLSRRSQAKADPQSAIRNRA